MKLQDAYANLTDTAKRQAIKDLAALLKARGTPLSSDYVRQILCGLRSHPCSEEVSRTISGYFRGQIGIDVAPHEATGVADKPAESPNESRTGTV